MFHAEGLDDIVTEILDLDVPPANLSEWEKIINDLEHPTMAVNVAMVGKYIELTDSYKSLSEALLHAGIHTHTKVNICYVDAEEIEKNGTGCLAGMDAILVPGGFGERGIDGKIEAIRYARINKVPYLGICLGMQLAVIEFARHVAGMKGAHSTEFRKDTEYPVIALITEWVTASGDVEQRNEQSDLGGTMRLGAQECRLIQGTRAREIYGKDVIYERHRHRYEVNDHYIDRLVAAGLVVCGRSLDGQLVEMIELPDHPWFIASQFHPEFTSSPRDGHPLFTSYIQAARKVHVPATGNGGNSQPAVSGKTKKLVSG